MDFDEEILSYNVSRETLQKIKDFMRILLEWNKKINLVSKNAEADLEIRHVLDSIQLINFIDGEIKLLVDVGSGSGFPGIILAIVMQEKYPLTKIVLVESITKKAMYLKDVCFRLCLSNVEIVNDRVENVVFKNVDYITARAVASMDKLLEYVKHLCSSKTRLVLLKGKTGQNELDLAAKKWSFEVKTYENRYAKQDGFVFCLCNVRKK